MKGLFVFFLAVVSVSMTSGRVQSMWDYHREHNTSVIPESRIIEGTEADEGDFPYQVRITIIGPTVGIGWCGGSIIAASWVLTVAHCATAKPPVSVLDYLAFYIEAGSVVANAPEQDNYVLFFDAYPHPGYNPTTLVNDIGLLNTLNDFDFSGNLVKPIKLATTNSYVGQFITVSGFGATSNGGSTSNVLLYTENLKVISFTACQTAYGTDPVPTTAFCAVDEISQDGISAVCSGDSGGPATLIIGGTVTQIGIISFVTNAGCDKGPQGFTDILQFLPWIHGITGPL